MYCSVDKSFCAAKYYSVNTSWRSRQDPNGCAETPSATRNILRRRLLVRLDRTLRKRGYCEWRRMPWNNGLSQRLDSICSQVSFSQDGRARRQFESICDHKGHFVYLTINVSYDTWDWIVYNGSFSQRGKAYSARRFQFFSGHELISTFQCIVTAVNWIKRSMSSTRGSVPANGSDEIFWWISVSTSFLVIVHTNLLISWSNAQSCD